MAAEPSTFRGFTDDQFMDALLEGWAKWSRSEPGPQPAPDAGRVLGIAFIREGQYQIRMTDDEFTYLDSRIPLLDWRFIVIIDLEYRSMWEKRRWLLTQEAKWRKLGIGYTTYSKRLKLARDTLFDELKPHIYAWMDRCR